MGVENIAEGLRPFAVPVSDLVIDAKNARKHGRANLAAIAESLSRFKQRIPIVVQKQGMVVRAGNGRVMAAKKLGWTHMAALVVDESEVEAVAYALADNRTAELASWDDANLNEAMRLISQQVDVEGILAATGFDRSYVERAIVGSSAEEPADPTIGPSVTKVGDVWILGKHRVVCGDSTDPEVAKLAMAGEVPNLMGTDPPYGVEYDASWREVMNHAPNRAVARVENDGNASWLGAYENFPGNVAYVWHADRYSNVVRTDLESAGYRIATQIIWVKQMVPGRGHYHHAHEPCWYAVRKGKTASWIGGRKQTTVWSVEHRRSETGHSTQKPEEVMRRPIVNHLRPGELCYDPFLGSGTTIVAAERSGRRACGVELCPEYVDLIVRRWQALTGGKATTVDGRQFGC